MLNVIKDFEKKDGFCFSKKVFFLKQSAATKKEKILRILKKTN